MHVLCFCGGFRLAVNVIKYFEMVGYEADNTYQDCIDAVFG